MRARGQVKRELERIGKEFGGRESNGKGGTHLLVVIVLDNKYNI